MISKDEFKKAFNESISAEFAAIPHNENSIEYTFSERFEKRMNRLLCKLTEK